LSIEVHGRNPDPDEASEERLLHVGILLEGHVLNHWRQLVMVTNHNPPLQAAESILRVLEREEETAAFCNQHIFQSVSNSSCETSALHHMGAWQTHRMPVNHVWRKD
jgi:hypothetical protein